MEIYLEFLMTHWILTLVFISLLIWIVKVESSSRVQGVQMLTPQQVTQYMNHHQAVIVDVRPTDKFEQGHILGALSMDSLTFKDKLKQLEKYQSKPVIIVCQLGQQAPKIGTILRKNGFGAVFGLKGGIQSWVSSDLPLDKSTKGNS